MIEMRLICSDKRIRAWSVSLDTKIDSGIRTASKVESSPPDLLRSSDRSIAGIYLRLALGLAAGKSSIFGSVGALVVLDGAGALECGAGVDEGATVG